MKNPMNAKNSSSSSFVLPAALSLAVLNGCAIDTKNGVDNILELPPENVTSSANMDAQKLHDQLLFEQAKETGVVKFPAAKKDIKVVSEEQNLNNHFGVVKADDIIKDLGLSKNSDKNDMM
ncbi:MAG: hypothetical protein PHS49_06890, partial [Candidatus Gracilibacteria bacterium]|nr:hypothetical protein [Candidatus Gracilibacteria bacterium]